MEEMEVDDGGVEGKVVGGDEGTKPPPVKTRGKSILRRALCRCWSERIGSLEPSIDVDQHRCLLSLVELNPETSSFSITITCFSLNSLLLQRA
jgi:hypothetical protein